LSKGAVFGTFAGFYYWVGKIIGLQYFDFYGKLQFIVFLLAVNLTFFPMHF